MQYIHLEQQYHWTAASERLTTHDEYFPTPPIPQYTSTPFLSTHFQYRILKSCIFYYSDLLHLFRYLSKLQVSVPTLHCSTAFRCSMVRTQIVFRTSIKKIWKE